MGSSSHKCRAKKTNLQKKVKRLQTERDKLNEKLKKCEIELEEKEQHLKRTIGELKLKELSRIDEKERTFYKVFIWIIFGVNCSIMPGLVNLMYSWLIGYDIKLSYIDITKDLFLVLFAISANLLSIILDEVEPSRLSLAIRLFASLLLTVFLVISLWLSAFLSNHATSIEMIPTETLRVRIGFYIALFCVILVIVLGIIIIIRQNKSTRD